MKNTVQLNNKITINYCDATRLTVDSQATFVFYFQIRAKSNFTVDSVSFYITKVSFACCQDCIIPFHTLEWEIQDGRCGIMKSYKC